MEYQDRGGRVGNDGEDFRVADIAEAIVAKILSSLLLRRHASNNEEDPNSKP